MARFNEIANHPEVRPHLGGGAEALDLAPVVDDPANVCLLNAHGGWIGQKQGDGLYEVHSMFLPEGRGSALIDASREALRYMFAATDCVELRTKVPDGNKGALGLARAAGFREQFRRENLWSTETGHVGVSYQSLTLERWRMLDPETLARGQWFHGKLEEAKRAQGSELPIHDDDEAHDRAVGASVLMVLAGSPRKAVWSYNRWAIFAGYAPIVLLSDAPAMIDVVDAIVAPNGNDMEVLLCR